MKKKKIVKKKIKTLKKGKIAPAKIKTVMEEYKAGDLPIGKSKKKVKIRKQAIAIALSQARKAAQ